MALKGSIRNEWVEAVLNGTADEEMIPKDILQDLQKKYKKFEVKAVQPKAEKFIPKRDGVQNEDEEE